MLATVAFCNEIAKITKFSLVMAIFQTIINLLSIMASLIVMATCQVIILAMVILE